MAEPEPSKFAHFESVKHNSLYSLYGRHAEVARDIHQDALRRFTGNDELTVDLVRESPIVPTSEGTLDSLERYDVVSVSSGVGLGAILHGDGIAGNDLVKAYREKFEEYDMPIYVVSAGNEGKTRESAMPRVADFARNSLVVGEANNSGAQPLVEEHSSRNNPTLTSDSPFNRGDKYQYYDVSPSLEGHENLIENWVIQNEINAEFDLFKEQNKDQEVDDYMIGVAYRAISSAKYQQYTETDEGKAWVKEQVDGYLKNPETLHSQIMAEFRENHDIDENGYVTGIDGTSFSAPEQAGYVSGALYEQEQREEQNLPILTKDEITTLAKMATLDTTAREGMDDPMHSYTNDDGHQFVVGGGHGVFNPDMFRTLLDEAYTKIGTQPDIDRTSVTTTMSVDIPEGHNANNSVTLKSNLPEGQDMVIDRIRLDTQFTVDGRVPHFAVLDIPGDDELMFTGLQESNSSLEFLGWSRMEHKFGETLPGGQDWKVRLDNGGDGILQEAEVTVYGYNQGGLMDQMMDYSKELALKMTPRPDAPTETPAPEPEGGGHEIPIPGGPR